METWYRKLKHWNKLHQIKKAEWKKIVPLWFNNYISVDQIILLVKDTYIFIYNWVFGLLIHYKLFLDHKCLKLQKTEEKKKEKILFIVWNSLIVYFSIWQGFIVCDIIVFRNLYTRFISDHLRKRLKFVTFEAWISTHAKILLYNKWSYYDLLMGFTLLKLYEIIGSWSIY